MSESKHTPGPWQVLPAEEGVHYLRVRGTAIGKRYKIANVHRDYYPEAPERIQRKDNEESAANARLIAAAPDLLKFAEMLLSNPHLDLGDLVYTVREKEGQGWEGPSVQQWGEAVTWLKETVKKAKGEA